MRKRSLKTLLTETQVSHLSSLYLHNPYLFLLFLTGDIDLFDEGEFEFKASGQDENDDKFDMYVGVLQEVLLEPEFEKLTKSFSNKHCMEFEATEENKLCYTSIFKEY